MQSVLKAVRLVEDKSRANDVESRCRIFWIHWNKAVVISVVANFGGTVEPLEQTKNYAIFAPLMELTEYTAAQLALRNGQDKPEIWIAFRGLIYEVTASRLWRDGKHYEHWAGQDLSDELKDAPHTEKVFEKFTIIGKLKGT